MKVKSSKRELLLFTSIGILVFALFLMFSPTVHAIGTNSKICYDSNTLNISYSTVSGNTEDAGWWLKDCPGGCSDALKDCIPINAQRESSGTPISIFIFLEAVGIILFISIFSNFLRFGKEGRIIISFIVILIFALMSYLSFRIEIGYGDVVYNIPIAILNGFFFILAFLNLMGIFFQKDERNPDA